MNTTHPKVLWVAQAVLEVFLREIENARESQREDTKLGEYEKGE